MNVMLACALYPLWLWDSAKQRKDRWLHILRCLYTLHWLSTLGTDSLRSTMTLYARRWLSTLDDDSLRSTLTLYARRWLSTLGADVINVAIPIGWSSTVTELRCRLVKLTSTCSLRICQPYLSRTSNHHSNMAADKVFHTAVPAHSVSFCGFSLACIRIRSTEHQQYMAASRVTASASYPVPFILHRLCCLRIYKDVNCWQVGRN